MHYSQLVEWRDCGRRLLRRSREENQLPGFFSPARMNAGVAQRQPQHKTSQVNRRQVDQSSSRGAAQNRQSTLPFASRNTTIRALLPL